MDDINDLQIIFDCRVRYRKFTTLIIVIKIKIHVINQICV